MQMFRFVLVLAVSGLLLGLAGCNTVRGVGKDIHDSAATVQSWISADQPNAQIAKKP